MAILIAVTSAFSFIPSYIWFGNEKYAPEDEESLLFSAALISDTHSDSSYFNDRSKILRKVMCGISRTDRMPDAMIIAGDISNASDPGEYRMLEWSMQTFGKPGVILPAAGNHDVRAADTFEEAAGYFRDFALFCGIKTDKTYYSAQVGGCIFIVLGSENMLSLEAEVSAEQLEWFEIELAAAVNCGKPVFIVCHQPLYNSNNVYYNPDSEKNWGIGSSSDKVEAILRKYVPDCGSPVFCISGHLHRNFDEHTVDSSFCDNLYCITLPSVTKTGEGGLGMAMEIYPEKILFRAIDYTAAKWINSFTYTIEY